MTILDKLSELEKAATPDWVYEPNRYSAQCIIGNNPHDDRWIAHFQPGFNGDANGQFAVAIRNAAPILIEVARSLKVLLGPENIGKTVDLSIDWSKKRHDATSAIAMIANTDALMACVRALSAIEQTENDLANHLQQK